MPARLERELKSEARKKGLKGEAYNRYVYGALRKTGWKPKGESNGKTSKGKSKSKGSKKPKNRKK